MAIHASITSERILEAVVADDYLGLCLECGEEIEGVEEDTHKDKCPECGAYRVYGAPELMMILIA